MENGSSVEARSPLAVFIAGDSNIFFPSIVAIESIRQNNPHLELSFYMAFNGKDLTPSMAHDMGQHGVQFVPTDSLAQYGTIEDLALMQEHRWPKDVFYNWLMPHYLADRGHAYAIKIDYDILCMAPYCQYAVQGYDSAFSVCDFNVDLAGEGVTAQAAEALDLTLPALHHSAYFNAGFVCINIAVYTQKNLFSSFKSVYKTLADHCPAVINLEQAAWSIVCNSDSALVGSIDPSYNVRATTLPEISNDGSAAVRNVHYVTGNKPWLPVDFTNLDRYVTAQRTCLYIFREVWLKFASTIPGYHRHVRANVPETLDTLGLLSTVLHCHYQHEAEESARLSRLLRKYEAIMGPDEASHDEQQQPPAQNSSMVKTSMDGSALSVSLENMDEALSIIDSNPADVNFVHVHHRTAFDDTSLNLVELARRDEQAYAAVVELACRQLYMYNRTDSRTSFVHRRRIPTLWRPVKEGQLQESDEGVFYSLSSPPPDANIRAPKLLVVFSAVSKPMYDWSLFRYFAKNYNSIHKFLSLSVSIMRIVDLGGVVGNFYLDTTALPDNTAAIQSTIRRVMDGVGVQQDSDVVLLGSSKGGTGALYHGLDMGLQHVVVDPIVDESVYWDTFNDLHFTRNRIFARTKQQVFGDLRTRLDNDALWENRLSQQVLITSERSPQYPYVSDLLIAERPANTIYVNNNQLIRNHPDVPVHSLHCATSSVDQLFCGVPPAAGRFEIE